MARGRGFDVIYVHDGPSLYVYSAVAGLIGAKLICHVHLRGSAPLEVIRHRLAESSIHISDHCAAGDPRGATATRGRAYLDLVCQRLGDFIVELVPTHPS